MTAHVVDITGVGVERPVITPKRASAESTPQFDRGGLTIASWLPGLYVLPQAAETGMVLPASRRSRPR
jgi:hypothetical protein